MLAPLLYIQRYHCCSTNPTSHHSAAEGLGKARRLLLLASRAGCLHSWTGGTVDFGVLKGRRGRARTRWQVVDRGQPRLLAVPLMARNTWREFCKSERIMSSW